MHTCNNYRICLHFRDVIFWFELQYCICFLHNFIKKPSLHQEKEVIKIDFKVFLVKGLCHAFLTHHTSICFSLNIFAYRPRFRGNICCRRLENTDLDKKKKLKTEVTLTSKCLRQKFGSFHSTVVLSLKP